MGKTTYRIADEKDYSKVKDLMLQALQSDPIAFSVSFSEYNIKSDSWWDDYVGPFVYQSNHRMSLAFDEDDLVGFSGLVFDFRERKKHVATVVWFFVLDSYRGQGIGRALLEDVIRIAKEQNVEKLSLMVNENQLRAIDIYEKYGFVKAGQLKKDIKIDDNFYDVLVLELFLN